MNSDHQSPSKSPAVDNWQEPPPPPPLPLKEQPQMTEAATLANIFFSPGETFEDLKRKPRFILALLIICLLSTAYSIALTTKIGDEQIRRTILEQLESNSQTASMTSEQKQNAVNTQMKISGVTRYLTPVFVAVFMSIGALLYFLGAKAFGGNGSFLHAFSTYTYSSLPPVIISMLLSFIVMALKSPDEIDLISSQRGLAQANLGFLINGKEMPVIATLISVFDLFSIWGWILAAIGLEKVNKISKSSAWAIVLIVALIGVTFRVIGALFSGNPS